MATRLVEVQLARHIYAELRQAKQSQGQGDSSAEAAGSYRTTLDANWPSRVTETECDGVRSNERCRISFRWLLMLTESR